ncbi:MAG: hypothetical protein AMJ68_06780 [Acidithiobacillales bacterium SG8_45]|nr:MAG: hypothetical protein AMJ68_06780 [Acidithiobacillales bacterium SG8_45]
MDFADLLANLPGAGLVFVAIFTVQFGSQVPVATFFGGYPWSTGPRRVMTQMLCVTTGEIRYPVTFLVLMVINDSLFH